MVALARVRGSKLPRASEGLATNLKVFIFTSIRHILGSQPSTSKTRRAGGVVLKRTVYVLASCATTKLEPA